MGELAQILALWHKAQASGESVAMATVLHVEGSSYRKPGARMLVTASGERAGTISGGCLEGEVSRKIWWLTQNGPAIAQYQSSFDEDTGEIPWGLGCGGTVWILLERDPNAVLSALKASVFGGTPAVILSSLNASKGSAPPSCGTVAVLSAAVAAQDDAPDPIIPDDAPQLPPALRDAAERAFSLKRSTAVQAEGAAVAQSRGISPGTAPAFFAEYIAPPPRLTIFGAGDDAQPLAHFADALGWRVIIADGRQQLLRPERFPQAAELRLLAYGDASAQPIACGIPSVTPTPAPTASASIPWVNPGVPPGELAILLTHSFEQDRALLAALLPLPLLYLGILGPLHRTRRLLEDVAPHLGLSIDACLDRLHAPVGLDLGARDPASIALAITAELQATLTGRRVQLERIKPTRAHA